MQKTTSSTVRPLTESSFSIASLSIGSTAVFWVLVAALHFLKPELDPAWRFLSEYATGEYGWMMAAAFLFLGLSFISLFAAVRGHVRTTGGKIGLVILLISALGTIIAAFNPMDPITAGPDEMTRQGSLHAVGSLLGVPTFPIAAALISWSLTRNPAWSERRRLLLWATAFTWVGLIVMFGTVFIMLGQNGGRFGPEVLIGWPNRFLMVTYSAWLIAVARRAGQLHEQEVEPE